MELSQHLSREIFAIETGENVRVVGVEVGRQQMQQLTDWYTETLGACYDPPRVIEPSVLWGMIPLREVESPDYVGYVKEPA